jgi:tripartite-type tricarboxylate transporter receptor subunit TctC
MAEAGLPGYAAIGYVGIMTTGGTPRDVIAKFNSAINEVVPEPKFLSPLRRLSAALMTGGNVERLRDVYPRRHSALRPSYKGAGQRDRINTPAACPMQSAAPAHRC